MINLKFCDIECRGPEVWTLFQDGTGCPSTPHPTNFHYHVIAHRLGYGDDLNAYCFEHEVLHSFCSEWLFDTPSAVLWGIAHGKILTGHEAAYEEMFTQAAQRWIRAGERPIIGGINWLEFKSAALEILDGVDR